METDGAEDREATAPIATDSSADVKSFKSSQISALLLTQEVNTNQEDIKVAQAGEGEGEQHRYTCRKGDQAAHSLPFNSPFSPHFISKSQLHVAQQHQQMQHLQYYQMQHQLQQQAQIQNQSQFCHQGHNQPQSVNQIQSQHYNQAPSRLQLTPKLIMMSSPINNDDTCGQSN